VKIRGDFGRPITLVDCQTKFWGINRLRNLGGINLTTATQDMSMMNGWNASDTFLYYVHDANLECFDAVLSNAMMAMIVMMVLIGGTMGTCWYVLVGTESGMAETFESTCHGPGRARSPNAIQRTLDHKEVMASLKEKGISTQVASPKLVTEEALGSYKDVCEIVDTF
jgi:hypothetical protein